MESALAHPQRETNYGMILMSPVRTTRSVDGGGEELIYEIHIAEIIPSVTHSGEAMSKKKPKKKTKKQSTYNIGNGSCSFFDMAFVFHFVTL